MNVGVVFDAGPAAYAGVQIEFFRNLLDVNGDRMKRVRRVAAEAS